MSIASKKVLLIFSLRDLEDGSVDQKIQKYNDIMLRLQKFEKISIDWHLMYAAPQFPCYTLSAVSISQIQNIEIARGKKFLKRVGKILDIPVEQQHLRCGNVDIQAWILSKKLNVNKVFGYSTNFNKFIGVKRKVKDALERTGIFPVKH